MILIHKHSILSLLLIIFHLLICLLLLLLKHLLLLLVWKDSRRIYKLILLIDRYSLLNVLVIN